jgi:hypothetical protein
MTRGKVAGDEPFPAHSMSMSQIGKTVFVTQWTQKKIVNLSICEKPRVFAEPGAPQGPPSQTHQKASRTAF